MREIQVQQITDVVEKLQGDERAHEICYETSMNEEYGFTSILKINGKAYNLDEYAYMSCPVQDVFYITDIAQDSKDFGDSNDGLEIAILDEGASDDPVTHFFKYNGELVYVGMVPGFPFKDYGNGIVNKDELVGLDGFTHQNGVYGTITTDLIETAYVDAYYWYDKENWAFKEMEIGYSADR